MGPVVPENGMERRPVSLSFSIVDVGLVQFGREELAVYPTVSQVGMSTFAPARSLARTDCDEFGQDLDLDHGSVVGDQKIHFHQSRLGSKSGFYPAE
jgi:hypothetical protein